MRPIDRSEILDLGSYESIRPQFRARLIAQKKNRRISVGDHMTFIFENRDTVLLQIQEMLRTERITSEAGIKHELDTYNTMVPNAGELFATLMIEYVDPDERAEALTKLADLGEHIRLIIGDKATKAEIEALPGEEDDRLPAVNYIRFRVGDVDPGETSFRLEIDHPSYNATTDLPANVRRELLTDLAEA